MSEVKHELCVVYPATLGYETDYRPATTAEIMDAHPKCGWCRYAKANPYDGVLFCTSLDSPYANPPEEALDPVEDYCRYWKPKETNNA